MKRGKILTGTASWSDPGFVQAWYPSDLPPAYRLRWYAEHFNLVEVNSTFYRVPEPKPLKRWCDDTPPGFVFDVKLHRFLSRHSTPLELLPPALRTNAEVKGKRVMVTPQLEKQVAQAFLRGIEPLKRAGKLGALLLQLSPAFSPRKHKLDELDHLLDLLNGYRVAIELRNGNWLRPDLAPATRKYFRDHGITFVMVDGPGDPHFTIMPGIDLVTSPQLAYLRAHGRNVQGYIRERTVAGRFDYIYSKKELKEIAQRATNAAARAQEVHVVYNNNKADYAPRAATEFQHLLAADHPEIALARLPRKELVHG